MAIRAYLFAIHPILTALSICPSYFSTSTITSVTFSHIITNLTTKVYRTSPEFEQMFDNPHSQIYTFFPVPPILLYHKNPTEIDGV